MNPCALPDVVCMIKLSEAQEQELLASANARPIVANPSNTLNNFQVKIARNLDHRTDWDCIAQETMSHEVLDVM